MVDIYSLTEVIQTVEGGTYMDMFVVCTFKVYIIFTATGYIEND